MSAFPAQEIEALRTQVKDAKKSKDFAQMVVHLEKIANLVVDFSLAKLAALEKKKTVDKLTRLDISQLLKNIKESSKKDYMHVWANSFIEDLLVVIRAKPQGEAAKDLEKIVLDAKTSVNMDEFDFNESEKRTQLKAFSRLSAPNKGGVSSGRLLFGVAVVAAASYIYYHHYHKK